MPAATYQYDSSTLTMCAEPIQHTGTASQPFRASRAHPVSLRARVCSALREEKTGQQGQYFYDDAAILTPKETKPATYFYGDALDTWAHPKFVAAEAAKKAQEPFAYHYDTATLLQPDFSFLHTSAPAANPESRTAASAPVKLPAYDIARAARKPDTQTIDEPYKKPMANVVEDMRETSARSVIAS